MVHEGIDNWIERFEPVARFNALDDAQMPANPYISLEETARSGFKNNEAALT